MGNTLFIQFFSQTGSGWFDLCNGFSDTWDLCRSKGDFLWIPLEQETEQWYDESAYTPVFLPIEKGTAYVSASYVNQLYQAYLWACQYPDIQFIVGGPVASERYGAAPGWHSVHFKVEQPLPSNLFLTGQSVESLFGVPEFSGRWHLEVPEQIPKNSRIYFSYTLENQCYWKKCPFCSIAQHSSEHFRKRKLLDLAFTDLNYNGHKIVRLNTGSMTPEHIRNILPVLPVRPDMEYRFFMRAAAAETRAMETAVSRMKGAIPDCTLGFGIEFPSDRMWQYLNKGTRMDEVIKTLTFCTKTGFKVNANVILGWNNLVEQDLRDLEGFMANLSAHSVTTLQLRWLFAHPYTRIYDTYDGAQNSIRLGPFNCGFNVRVNPDQQELNQRAGRIIKKYCDKKGITLQGYKNLNKGLA
ncbi:MAG TPA: radical SAM protein [Desulfotignum sp.]|nr:radical SAM protein [Desulfotignum sp.]